MIATALTPRHWLSAPAAASWRRMEHDSAGVVTTAEITDAGRTYAEQVALFLDRYEPRAKGTGPFGDVQWWRGVRYVRVRGASAAVPGTSNHEDGNALDLTGATLEWVIAHGRRYGWVAFRVAGERWHVEYLAALDTTTSTPAPAPAPLEEDIMATVEELRAVVHEAAPLFRMRGGAAAWLDLGTGRRHITAGQSKAPAYGYRTPVDLEPADGFWLLPIVGRPGEVYRRVGDSTGACWLYERSTEDPRNAVRRHVDAAAFAAMGGTAAVAIIDLPADHPLWAAQVG